MDIFTEWPLTTILLLLSIFCILLYNNLRSNKSSNPNPPPSPPRLPILGNLHQLLGKPRHKALWQLSKQYGPVMQIHTGSKPCLIISSPAMAKQILKTQDHIFCSRGDFQATKRITYDYIDVAFSPHSGHWRDMRKILVSEFLSPKRTKQSHHVLVTEMESMIRSLSLNPPNTEVNLSNMLFVIVKQMVCKVAFGINYRQQPLKGPSLDAMISESMELLNGSVGDAFPILGIFIDQFSGWNRRLSEGFRNLDSYIDTIIDDHLKDNVEELSEEDKDFVHALLEMSSKENASGYRLTNAEIKALILDVLMGGIDTTVVALTWLMSELIKNTRVKQKLQKEIRNCAGVIQNVAEMNTASMSYLKMVVKESLRFYTVTPCMIPHVSLSHTKIGGYDVNPGTLVLTNAWGIARDPSVWGENADEFYPERFENLDGDHIGWERFDMLPFGGGRRSCPAMNTAPTTIEFVIANLLYWFDWELPSEDLNMESEGTPVLRRKVPLCLVPTKHK